MANKFDLIWFDVDGQCDKLVTDTVPEICLVPIDI